MSLNFEELDFKSTSIGDLVLRRRRMPQFGDLDIYEVKLGEEFLMTSLFHEAEDQLAHLGIAANEKPNLDVVVGGLGLGYTAVAALECKRVSQLTVIEFLENVIDWHKKEMVPMGKMLNQDERCHLVHSDFFELSKGSHGFDPTNKDKKHDVILLDIDHKPDFVLNADNSHFYSVTGLSELSEHLTSGGVFALWADGRPQQFFTDRLNGIFSSAHAHTIEFSNPLNGGTSVGTVYVAKKDVD